MAQLTTPKGDTYATTIRIKRTSHDALSAYADEHGVTYSHAANLFLLKGLLSEGLITKDEYREAMKRRSSRPAYHAKKKDWYTPPKRRRTS